MSDILLSTLQIRPSSCGNWPVMKPTMASLSVLWGAIPTLWVMLSSHLMVSSPCLAPGTAPCACGIWQREYLEGLSRAVILNLSSIGFEVVMKLKCHLYHCDDKEAVSELKTFMYQRMWFCISGFFDLLDATDSKYDHPQASNPNPKIEKASIQCFV